MRSAINADGIDDAFGHWLAGFVDGEGCFTIMLSRGGNQVRFHIGLRDDDAAILEEIRRRTGLGWLNHYRGGHGANSKPQSRWNVSSRDECLRLVDIFDRYPLRAKKARDYQIWREAVLEWTRLPRRYAGRHATRDWSRLATLRDLLVNGRKYGDDWEPIPSQVAITQLSLDNR